MRPPSWAPSLLNWAWRFMEFSSLCEELLAMLTPSPKSAAITRNTPAATAVSVDYFSFTAFLSVQEGLLRWSAGARGD